MEKITFSTNPNNINEFLVKTKIKEYDDNAIQQEMLRRPEKKMLELRKNNIKNILNNKDKVRQMSDDDYNYPHLQIKLEELDLPKELVDEYNIYDDKLEVIDDLLKKSDNKDQTKFAIYHLKIFSTFSFEEGEENIFNTEIMFSIFNSLLIILKYTQENDIKYEIMITLYNMIKENESFLLSLLEKENLDLLFSLTFYNEEGIIYSALLLLSGLLTKDELSWKLMKEIDFVKRLGELLSVESLSIPIRYICIQNVTFLINNHSEEEEIIEELEANTFNSIYKIYKNIKEDVLFEISIFNHLILNYFYKITNNWTPTKFKSLLKSNFFEDVLLDFGFSLEKFIMTFNKNETFHIFLDKIKNNELVEHFNKNLVYNEKYEILMKDKLYNKMDEDNTYSFSSDCNIFTNIHTRKLFNMIDLLSVRMKFFTNVFYSFESEETMQLLTRNFHLIQSRSNTNLANMNIDYNNQNPGTSLFNPNSLIFDNNSTENQELKFDIVLNYYINESNNLIRKIRVLSEISKDFKTIKVGESFKFMKNNEEQFNVFDFLENLSFKIEIMLSDFMYLFNNMAMNIPKFNSLIVKSTFIEDLFYIADFNKSKKLNKNLLLIIDELYSNSSTQQEYILTLINYPKFKDLLSEVVLNYKNYDIESLKFALVFIRESLIHLKNLSSHSPYCEMRAYYQINNVCLIIDELTLHTDTNVTNYALLIEKENWTFEDIYACQNNSHMKVEF